MNAEMRLDSVLATVSEHVATVTVNRPEKRNALNGTVRREIVQVLDAIRDEEDVRVVVFTGAGEKAFVAGADVAEFDAVGPIEQRLAMDSRRLYDEVAVFPKPTIASIRGFALGGGCELALACDLRIAARSARLGQPEIKLGLLPGGGGTQRLPRLIGYGQALRLILTGDPIDADEAHRIGLVELLVDDAQLEERTRDLARTLAERSPLALRLAKDALRAALEMPLSAGLRYERELFVTAFASRDKAEGVRAFLEKRPPRFIGR